jgi:hypothetical protein
MECSGTDREKRRRGRTKAVLPIRVRGNDASGKIFEDLAHTLDITPTGARLGAIHHALKVLDRIIVTYRQRKIEFKVIWTKRIEGTAEYQVGVQALAQDGDAWGLSHSESNVFGRERAESALAGASA